MGGISLFRGRTASRSRLVLRLGDMGDIDRTWLFIAAGLAFFLILTIRNRKKRIPETKVYSRRIEGFQVVAFLHPKVSQACLADHGVQFGKGFRRKEGPSLPHDERCRCRTSAFSYTSNEAFHGALRKFRDPDVSIERLPAQESKALLDAMRAENGAHPPETVEQYLERSGLSQFSPDSRSSVEAFLRERFEFLRTTPAAAPA